MKSPVFQPDHTIEHELYLALGSNIEPRLYYIRKALDELGSIFRIQKISSIYETGPIDDTAQQDFYNLCVLCTTKLDDPLEILDIIKGIEIDLGRVKDPNRPKGPRNIDIDILFFGELETNTDTLSIPHKCLYKRRFFLEPLFEILPEGSKYIMKYDLAKRLSEVKGQRAERSEVKVIG
jgi:2-amino-4-hydroxy-6-hydroxymethyldihydropteridine diphosphokinase